MGVQVQRRKTQTVQRRASSLVSDCGESRKGGSREDKPKKIGGSGRSGTGSGGGLNAEIGKWWCPFLERG